MEPYKCFPKIFPVEVRVDLRGGDAFMSQHFLDGPKVRPAFYQVGGE
jgi:hypothetical protein